MAGPSLLFGACFLLPLVVKIVSLHLAYSPCEEGPQVDGCYSVAPARHTGLVSFKVGVLAVSVSVTATLSTAVAEPRAEPCALGRLPGAGLGGATCRLFYAPHLGTRPLVFAIVTPDVTRRPCL